MRIIFVLGVLLTSATGSAGGEYYIVQDSSTKQCTIVDSPPATTQLVLIDNGRVFAHREEAVRTLASLTLCSSRTESANAQLKARMTETSNPKPGPPLKNQPRGAQRTLNPLGLDARHYTGGRLSNAPQHTLNPSAHVAL